MRISDWSSDVCSSDLAPGGRQPLAGFIGKIARREQAARLRRFERVEQRRHRARASGRQYLDRIAKQPRGHRPVGARVVEQDKGWAVRPWGGDGDGDGRVAVRSEEGRVGKEGVRTCRSRGSTDPEKKN